MKFRFLLLILFVLLFSLGCHSSRHDEILQPNSASEPDSLSVSTEDLSLDSLLKMAATMPQDTTLAMLYYQIAEKYEDHDFQKTTDYLKKMGTLCEELNWNE